MNVEDGAFATGQIEGPKELQNMDKSAGGQKCSDAPDRRAVQHAPPIASRFRKGQSGNPKGRPRGRHRLAPYEAILGQLVTIREGGLERRVSAAEAFLLHLTKRGLEGDGPSARSAMEAIEKAQQLHGAQKPLQLNVVTISFVNQTGVTRALEALKLGRRLDPYQPSVRVMLEPWIVQVAIDHLGENQLNQQQQRIVVAATRTPHKVKWPRWWTEVP